jgi:hypothetical protein
MNLPGGLLTGLRERVQEALAVMVILKIASRRSLRFTKW